MASPELTARDEFDPNYWYPLTSASAFYIDKEPQAADHRHRQDNKKMEQMAETLRDRLANPKAPAREILYGLVLDLSEIPAETFVRFCRERLTVASHPDLATANIAAEKDRLSQGGLAGIRYSPRPTQDYYPAERLHTAYRYEEQEGLGIVLYNDKGQLGVFSVRPVKKRINKNPLHKHGIQFNSSDNVQETFTYEFEDLRLPTNKPALVGFSSQSVTKSGEGVSEVEVCRLERIKYFQVL